MEGQTTEDGKNRVEQKEHEEKERGKKNGENEQVSSDEIFK